MDIVITLGVGIIVVCSILCGIECIEIIQEKYQPKSIEITIEYLWEENGKYYFADIGGNVYRLGNYVDINEKILYNDMPKQRFTRLNIGAGYNCMYISGTNNWISISETEVKKNDRRNK